MIKYKTVEVPATTKQEFDCLVCDICKKETKHRDWGDGRFETANVTIAVEEGSSYPEGTGSKETVGYDVCIDCFKEKVMPFLASLGVQPTITESDW